MQNSTDSEEMNKHSKILILKEPVQASGIDDSNHPHLVREIKRELDNEISEEMLNSEDVNMELGNLDNSEKITECQVMQSGLCRSDRHIKEEISDDKLKDFTNSQDDVQKIQVDSECNIQQSQLERDFSENLPEHVRNIENNRDVTEGLERETSHSRNIVKNTSEEAGDFEMVHEHKGNTLMKDENKNEDMCLVSREKIFNDLGKSAKIRKHQVMDEGIIGKIAQNEQILAAGNGECSKLSEKEFCASKRDTRHTVCHVSCENLDKCDVCGVDFTKPASLNTSKQNHGGGKSDKCHISNLESACTNNLTVHESGHTEEKHYTCGVCYRGFVEFIALKRHIEQPVVDKPYKCDICGVGFAQKGNMQIHKRTHTGEKPYKCDICDAAFTLTSSLKVHVRKHTGEKPYKCDFCGVGFTHAGHLQRHRKIHTGEKPYTCDICGAGFAQKGNLHIHRRKHTGEKPYKCGVCGLGFTQKGNLQTHERKHTGDQPYKCDICGVGFNQIGNLQIHIRKHTGETPYRCNDCGVEFTQMGNLQMHRRKHAGEKLHRYDAAESDCSEYTT